MDGLLQVGDEGVQALAGLQRLQSLSLHCCRGVTDAGLAPLAASLTSLTSLNLSGCCHVSGGEPFGPPILALAKLCKVPAQALTPICSGSSFPRKPAGHRLHLMPEILPCSGCLA